MCATRADDSRRPGSESETYETYLEWQDRLKESEAAGTQFTCFTVQLTSTKVQILTRKAAPRFANDSSHSSSPAELFSPQERLVGGEERAEKAKIQRVRYSQFTRFTGTKVQTLTHLCGSAEHLVTSLCLRGHSGTQFACFTSATVQILTQHPTQTLWLRVSHIVVSSSNESSLSGHTFLNFLTNIYYSGQSEG